MNNLSRLQYCCLTLEFWKLYLGSRELGIWLSKSSDRVQSLEIVYYFPWREMMLFYFQTVSYVCRIKLEKKITWECCLGDECFCVCCLGAECFCVSAVLLMNVSDRILYSSIFLRVVLSWWWIFLCECWFSSQWNHVQYAWECRLGFSELFLDMLMQQRNIHTTVCR
jgi:hypothetical protein